MKRLPFTTLTRTFAALCGLAAFLTAQAQPSIHSVYPDGAVQLQATNILGFGASSSGPDIDATGISVKLTSLNLLGQTVVTNLTSANGLVVGGGPAERSVTTALKTDILSYTAVIIVTDAIGGSATNTVSFDTLAPTLMIEAEDFNHDSGQITNSPVPGAYAFLDGVEGIDAHDNNLAEGSHAYRPTGMQTETTSDKPRQIFLDAFVPDYNVGWTSGGEWGNYTRTFPAGVYNVYMRAARGNGGNASATLAMVTSDPTQGGQTTGPNLGNFVVPSTGNWQSYTWVPLLDAGGAVQKVTLGGVQTVRFTVGDGYNVNYYAFFPANTNLPSVHDIYPDGSRLFQPTNTMRFIASSTVGIDPSGINVDLTATNLIGGVTVTNLTSANGLTIGGTALDRTVTLPLQANVLFYQAVIHVTDQTANSLSATAHFNTLSPSYSLEAEDFNYNNGLFIDGPQTNAFLGLNSVEGVDFHHSIDHSSGPYRPVGYNNEGCGDVTRDEYASTGFTDYNVGWNDGGNWANYTRTLPSGTYNVFIRAANGAGGPGSATWAEVTSGATNATQTTTNLGAFSIPQTGGWQTYTWAPLKDAGGNLVPIPGAAVKTFRVTAGGAYNANFYAFFPADTSLPIIDQIYPDGADLFQYTNTLRFRVSSSAGIATGNITVTVDGANVSGLSFSGSSISWNVTYTNLSLNAGHIVTITVLANNGLNKVATLQFDTMKASYYQVEAEDYDFDAGQFIDNPQVNGYLGRSASPDVDFHDTALGGTYTYRPSGTATDFANDKPRAQFSGFTDYIIGFFENGEWGNYTRNYPAGTYNVWLRASTGTGYNEAAYLEQVTSGLGTGTQTTQPLGNFTVPSNGWGIYNWVRLNDANNQPAVVTLTSQPATLRFGRPVSTGGMNANFLILVPTLAPIPLQLTRTGNNNAISFPTQTGFSYQVQYKDSLTDPTWTNVGSLLPGNNAMQTVNDSTAGTARYYRAVVSQP